MKAFIASFVAVIVIAVVAGYVLDEMAAADQNNTPLFGIFQSNASG